MNRTMKIWVRVLSYRNVSLPQSKALEPEARHCFPKRALFARSKRSCTIFPQGASPWQRVLKYIVPVFILSAVFNIPKCFEAIVFEDVVEESR